jgi:hypothetical protein
MCKISTLNSATGIVSKFGKRLVTLPFTANSSCIKVRCLRNILSLLKVCFYVYFNLLSLFVALISASPTLFIHLLSRVFLFVFLDTPMILDRAPVWDTPSVVAGWEFLEMKLSVMTFDISCKYDYFLLNSTTIVRFLDGLLGEIRSCIAVFLWMFGQWTYSAKEHLHTLRIPSRWRLQRYCFRPDMANWWLKMICRCNPNRDKWYWKTYMDLSEG